MTSDDDTDDPDRIDPYENREPGHDRLRDVETFRDAAEDVVWSYQNVHPDNRAEVLRDVADELEDEDSKFRSFAEQILSAAERSGLDTTEVREKLEDDDGE